MKSDLNSHSVTEAHLMSKAKMDAFLQTYTQPDRQISNILHVSEKDIVEKTENFLLKSSNVAEFYGRQGMALRGHRDDSLEPEKKTTRTFQRFP